MAVARWCPSRPQSQRRPRPMGGGSGHGAPSGLATGSPNSDKSPASAEPPSVWAAASWSEAAAAAVAVQRLRRCPNVSAARRRSSTALASREQHHSDHEQIAVDVRVHGGDVRIPGRLGLSFLVKVSMATLCYLTGRSIWNATELWLSHR
jgi:hypothetical protein